MIWTFLKALDFLHNSDYKKGASVIQTYQKTGLGPRHPPPPPPQTIKPLRKKTFGSGTHAAEVKTFIN